MSATAQKAGGVIEAEGTSGQLERLHSLEKLLRGRAPLVLLDCCREGEVAGIFIPFRTFSVCVLLEASHADPLNPAHHVYKLYLLKALRSLATPNT